VLKTARPQHNDTKPITWRANLKHIKAWLFISLRGSHAYDRVAIQLSENKVNDVVAHVLVHDVVALIP